MTIRIARAWKLHGLEPVGVQRPVKLKDAAAVYCDRLLIEPGNHLKSKRNPNSDQAMEAASDQFLPIVGN
jgi:hypothetical protein